MVNNIKNEIIGDTLNSMGGGIIGGLIVGFPTSDLGKIIWVGLSIFIIGCGVYFRRKNRLF